MLFNLSFHTIARVTVDAAIPECIAISTANKRIDECAVLTYFISAIAHLFLYHENELICCGLYKVAVELFARSALQTIISKS